MGQKRLKLSVLVLLGLGLTSTQAQTLYVNQSSGNQTTYSLNEIQKMTFSSSELVITKTDNSITGYSIAGLRYLSFTDYLTDIRQISRESGMIQVYPNPVGKVLNIKLPGAGTVQILSPDGKVMLTKQVPSAGVTTFNIEHLQSGIYVCRYFDGIAPKTVKIIKQ